MIYFLTLAVMTIITVIISVLFIVLDNKFNIKIKYFSLIAKNKTLYYLILITWLIVLLILLIMSYPIDNSFNFIILIVYFAIFINLYNRAVNWTQVYNIYIKNVSLLGNNNKK